MKIAMIHWGFPPVIGGVETHLSILCPELVKRGHEVSILTSTAPKMKKEHTYKGVDVYRNRIMDVKWLKERGFENLRDKIDDVLYDFIEKVKPDVLHAHNMHYISKYHTFALERIAKEKNIPLILTAHNVMDSGLSMRLLLDVKWDKIIAVSDYVKRELKGFGVPSKRIITVHHGVDVQRIRKKRPASLLRKYPILEGKKIIVHPAKTSMFKGSDVSIKAMKRVVKKFPDAFLVLCGTGLIVDWDFKKEKDLAYLDHLIHKMGLQDNILVDSFSIEQMIQLYKLSEFTVYPSTWQEPFGLTMIESMACGRPIIVTRSGGMPEAVEHGKNGFVIDIRNVDQLAKYCLQLLRDDELRKEMGANGRKIVSEKFNKKQMADKTIEVYESVVRRKK